MPTILYRISVYANGRQPNSNNIDNRLERAVLRNIERIRREIKEYVFEYIPLEVYENSRPFVITSDITRDTVFDGPYVEIVFQNSPEYTRRYLDENFGEIEPFRFELGGYDMDIVFDLRDIYEGDLENNDLQINDINYVRYNNRNRRGAVVSAHVDTNNIENIGNVMINRNYMDQITQNQFEEGENVIRLQKNDRYVFKPEGILQWTHIAKTNPLTRNRITKRNMEKGKAKFRGGKTRRRYKRHTIRRKTSRKN